MAKFKQEALSLTWWKQVNTVLEHSSYMYFINGCQWRLIWSVRSYWMLSSPLVSMSCRLLLLSNKLAAYMKEKVIQHPWWYPHEPLAKFYCTLDQGRKIERKDIPLDPIIRALHLGRTPGFQLLLQKLLMLYICNHKWANSQEGFRAGITTKDWGNHPLPFHTQKNTLFYFINTFQHSSLFVHDIAFFYTVALKLFSKM